MAIDKTKVGIIGCGNISRAYFTGLGFFPHLEIAACADLNVDLAKEKAAEWNVPRGCSVDELLADPDIEVVVNLTIPAAHAPVDLQILEAGKHPYSEKPLAVEREDGKKVLAVAAEKGLRTGCAPDTARRSSKTKNGTPRMPRRAASRTVARVAASSSGLVTSARVSSAVKPCGAAMVASTSGSAMFWPSSKLAR